MRSTFTLLALILFLSPFAFSQDSAFQLKDYQYRTSGYRALSFSAGMSGSHNRLEYEDSARIDENNSQWNLYPLSIDYYSTYNKDKKIHTTAVSIWATGSTSRLVNNQKIKKSRNLLSSFYFNSNDLFYKGKSFLELGAQLTSDLSINRWIDTSDSKARQNVSELTLTLGTGRGRIENVRDAQMSMFILNDLKKQGLLSVQPNAQDYYELASLITQINNKRVFDYRRRRIYELTQIDSFIRKKGLAQTDIRHFTSINDNWSLALNPFRLSGLRWYFRIRPGANVDVYHSQYQYPSSFDKYRNDAKSVFAGAQIGIEKYKPVNLHWQHNLNANISMRHNWNFNEFESNFNGQVNNSEINSTDWDTEATVYYELEYFPNNRTILSTSLQLTAGHNVYYQYTQKIWLITPRFNFHTNYFLGYRTRLFCDLLVYEDFYTSNVTSANNLDTKYLGAAFSVGISHSIF